MIQKTKKWCITTLNDLTSATCTYFPVMIFGILLCFCVNAIFGPNMVVVGLVTVFTVKEIYRTAFSLRNYLTYAALLLAVVLLGTLASIQFLLGAVINFAVIAFLAFVFCDNFTRGGYFTISLQLLLMQYQGRVSIDVLPARLLCYLFCIAVSGVFLVLINNLFKKHKDNVYVIRGCKAISNKLNLLLGNEVKDDTDMFVLTTEFCKDNYSIMVNQGYLLDESTRHDFLALMTMEQMSDLIYDTVAKLENLNDKDREYFEELIRAFSKIKNLKRLSIELSNFADDYTLSNPQLSSLWKKYILILADYLKYKGKPVIKSNIKDSTKFRVSVLKKRFSLTSYNMRSALQLTSIVTICAVVGQIVPVTEVTLIPIVALAVLSIYPNTKLRYTIPGVVGIIVVAVLYMLILSSLPFALRLPVSFIISVIGVVVTKSQFAQLAFATQLISSVIYPTAVISPEVLIKVGFVAVGCCASWLLVRWIFNTPEYRRYKLHTSDLAQFDWTAIRLLEQVRMDNSDVNYLCEFMFIQHLMVEHISNSSTDKVDSNRIRYSSMLSFNCDLLTEIAYAITILKPSKLPKDWILAMKKRLTNIF